MERSLSGIQDGIRIKIMTALKKREILGNLGLEREILGCWGDFDAPELL